MMVRHNAELGRQQIAASLQIRQVSSRGLLPATQCGQHRRLPLFLAAAGALTCCSASEMNTSILTSSTSTHSTTVVGNGEDEEVVSTTAAAQSAEDASTTALAVMVDTTQVGSSTTTTTTDSFNASALAENLQEVLLAPPRITGKTSLEWGIGLAVLGMVLLAGAYWQRGHFRSYSTTQQESGIQLRMADQISEDDITIGGPLAGRRLGHNSGWESDTDTHVKYHNLSTPR